MSSRRLTHTATGRGMMIGSMVGIETKNMTGRGGGHGLETGGTGITTETEIAEVVDMIVEITDMTGIEEVIDMNVGGGMFIVPWCQQESLLYL